MDGEMRQGMKTSRWGRLLLAVAGSLAYAAAFPPVELTALAWLAPALWLTALRGLPGGQRFRVMFLPAYIGTALVVHWLWALFSGFSMLLWIIPALYLSLWAGISGITNAAPRWLRIVWPAIAWTGLEYFRAEMAPLSFAFGGLGASQANGVGFGLASAVGVYGVSGIMVLAGALAVELVFSRGRAPWLWVTTAILAGLTAYLWMDNQPTRRNNIGRVWLQQLAQTDDIASWTQIPDRPEDVQAPDLIVWPELTYANDPSLPECRWFVNLMKHDAANARWGSIFGAVRLAEGSRSVMDPFYNTAYYMQHDGEIIASAGKNQPVQFIADGLPAEDVAVIDLVEVDSNRREGMPAKSGLRIGLGICYDGSFQKYARRMVSRGARALIFPTMNIETWGPIQHTQHQRLFQMRAAETGRSVATSAVSGPTFMAQPGGWANERAPYHQTVTLREEFLEPNETLFNRGGWLTGPVCLGLLAVGVLLSLIGTRRAGNALGDALDDVIPDVVDIVDLP